MNNEINKNKCITSSHPETVQGFRLWYNVYGLCSDIVVLRKTDHSDNGNGDGDNNDDDDDNFTDEIDTLNHLLFVIIWIYVLCTLYWERIHSNEPTTTGQWEHDACCQ